MSIKKTLMLASMALAAIAFAVPATASANQLTWTNGHTKHIGTKANEQRSEAFEGFLDFTAIGVTPHSTFGCDVTIIVETTGPTAGKVTKFEPTTATCVGTGIFTGCKLVKDTVNTPWNVTITGTDLVFKHPTAGVDITVHNEYTNCPVPPGITTSHLLFEQVTGTITTTPLNPTISSIAIHGVTTDGAATATGSVAPENPPGDVPIGVTA